MICKSLLLSFSKNLGPLLLCGLLWDNCLEAGVVYINMCVLFHRPWMHYFGFGSVGWASGYKTDRMVEAL